MSRESTRAQGRDDPSLVCFSLLRCTQPELTRMITATRFKSISYIPLHILSTDINPAPYHHANEYIRRATLRLLQVESLGPLISTFRRPKLPRTCPIPSLIGTAYANSRHTSTASDSSVRTAVFAAAIYQVHDLPFPDGSGLLGTVLATDFDAKRNAIVHCWRSHRSHGEVAGGRVWRDAGVGQAVAVGGR
jgi:hypothetical protein